MKEGNLGLITTDAADSLSTDLAAARDRISEWLAKAWRPRHVRRRIGTENRHGDRQRKGMRVGPVTNAPLYDASPAAFLSHVPNVETTPRS